jgi:membrane fusion protein, heavy metal efflux system
MNKNIKIIGGVILALLIGLIIYKLYFAHDHAEGHVHDDGSVHGSEQSEGGKKEDNHTEAGHEDGEEEHEAGGEHGHDKMVVLNEAQFKNAAIDTGWFEQKNLSEVINTNGYTKLPPQNQAHVSVQFPGVIKSIKVIEGQYVKAGQTIATMSSMSYNNLRLEKEKLAAELQSSLTNLEFLKVEYQRQKELTEGNVSAKKVFQKVSADLQMEEGKIKALNSQIDIIGQNLSIGGNGTSALIPITAPISGNISEINVNIGSAADPGKDLFSIVDNSKMHVDLLVYEKDLYKVKPGQSVRFILTNQGNKEIKGKIFSIGKTFQNDTKSVAVHADIVNEKQLLIPGMYVNALIDVGLAKVEALPIDAIVKAEGREFIFLYEKENMEAKPIVKAGDAEHEDEISFSRIEVKTGATQLGFVQVTPLTEIHKGDKIVTKGAYYLQAHLQKSEGGGGHDH